MNQLLQNSLPDCICELNTRIAFHISWTYGSISNTSLFNDDDDDDDDDDYYLLFFIWLYICLKVIWRLGNEELLDNDMSLKIPGDKTLVHGRE